MSLTTNSQLQLTTKARNSLLQLKHNQVWVVFRVGWVGFLGRFVGFKYGSVSWVGWVGFWLETEPEPDFSVSKNIKPKPSVLLRFRFFRFRFCRF